MNVWQNSSTFAPSPKSAVYTVVVAHSFRVSRKALVRLRRLSGTKVAEGSSGACVRLAPKLDSAVAWARSNPLRIFSSVVILFVTISLAASGLCQSTPDADAKELARLETVWNEAHERGDSDVLNALWADDLEVAVPKMPVMTKDEVLAFARTGRMKFQRYATSDLRIRVYGDAAVVTGRLQRTRTLNGNEVSDDWRFTKTYVRAAGKWRVVSFHASENIGS
jgi:hypothetical protein